MWLAVHVQTASIVDQVRTMARQLHRSIMVFGSEGEGDESAPAAAAADGQSFE